MKKLLAAMMVVWMLGLAGAAGYAAEEGSSPPPTTPAAPKDPQLPIYNRDHWQFFVSPYLWVPGVNFNATVNHRGTSVGVPWWDVVGLLFSKAIGAMGRVEVWKGRWGVYLDSYFIYVGDTASDSARRQILTRLPFQRTLVLSGQVKFIARAGNLDFALRYLVGSAPLITGKALPVASFELLGGGRFNWYNQDVSLGVAAQYYGRFLSLNRGVTLTNKIDRSYVEPFLGMRLSFWLTPKATILLRGTVGGFGLVADGNLDSDNEISLGYKVTRSIYVYGGYRARYDQFTKGAATYFNGWIHGPILGAVFSF
jgi:hypothetical protein